MKNKGTIIAVVAIALVLLVSAGIAIAAGVSGDGCPASDTQQGYGATRAAGNAYSFGCHNSGEGDRIRGMNCAGEENGACEGDCEQDRLRECDGECDGAQSQTQNRYGSQPAEESAVTGLQADTGMQNGACAGDCDRDQDRLRDESCDGTCDGTCDGDGTQSQNRNGS